MPISNITNGESGSDARTSLNEVIDKINGVEAGANISRVVFLGEFTCTSAATLPCDNIFDAAVYDHYIISGNLIPATDKVSLSWDLRTAVPGNVSATYFVGGSFASSSSSGSTFASVLSTLVGNSTNEGVFINGITLKINTGYNHNFAVGIITGRYDASRYWYDFGGEFNDTTPRQGIVFSFSSGNIATGLIRIWGVKKS